MNKYKEMKVWVWLERFLFPAILLLYPLRHIHWGLDLMDTGYNYGNFQFMGTEHMDPMWLFSTYLANACGALLMKLPFADSLMGMNFYTGLFISVLALLGYWFCIRKIGMPAGVVFLGEFLAVSLCWCPTALLYNYLTYVLFLGGCILLYLGLRDDKNKLLVLAGVCLGANIFVRFSNLAEASLIVAVWAYGVICRDSVRKTAARTGFCMLGYLCAFGVGFLFMTICYGSGAYVEGILNLLGMTETATDYTAGSMITKMIFSYIDMKYWVLRPCVLLAAVLFCMCLPNKGKCTKAVVSALAGAAAMFWLYGKELRALVTGTWEYGDQPGIMLPAIVGCVIGSLVVGILVVALVMIWRPKAGMPLFSIWAVAAAFCWWYHNGFCSFLFWSYDSMLRPGIVFLILAMVIGVIMVLRSKTAREDKLISGIVILVILVTSLGSNNGVFPSLNNLFIAGPYVFWMILRLCRVSATLWKKKVWGMELTVFSLPVKIMAVAFLMLMMVQGIGFGAGFVFAEGTGVRDADTQVENNAVLRGIYMNAERAGWMEEISTYVNAHDLEGREVLLYGQIPSLAYYLNMPPAFNSWSDLASYRLGAMEEDMAKMQEALAGLSFEELGKVAPVVILEQKYQDYQALAGEDEKLALIAEFMVNYGYQQTFSNEKFVMFECR